MTRIGERVASVDALEALPVGAAVTIAGRKKLLTRHPDGWAEHRDDRRRHDSAKVWWDGMELVSLPDVFYAGPMPGDPISTHEQAEALPVGGVCAEVARPEHRWQKGDSTGEYDPEYGWYNTYNAANYGVDEFIRHAGGHPMVVESVPEDLGETVAQFAWRFRDLALTGAERALGSPDAALPILNTLGLGFTPSVGLWIVNKYDRGRLPENTVVYSGDPAEWGTFGLWVKKGLRWTKVFGGANTSPNDSLAVTIDQLPDATEPAAWLSQRATAEDRQKIIEFRATAWHAGYAEKKRRSWCSEFERVMLRGGMSEDSARYGVLHGFRVGQQVTPEQAATLAIGVILSTPDGTDQIAVFRREAKATNRAGTRRLAGHNFKGHYADQMVIRSAPGDPGMRGLGVRMTNELMVSMPVGSVIGSGVGNVFIKVEPNHRGEEWTQLHDFDTAAEGLRAGASTYAAGAFHPGPRCQFMLHRVGPREENSA